MNIFIKGQILVGLDDIRRNENFCDDNLETAKGKKPKTHKAKTQPVRVQES